MIVTICYDHQTTESAINYLSQEHNRIARVDLNRHHFIHKHGVVLAHRLGNLFALAGHF